MSVVALETQRTRSNQQVIDQLETALAEAKNGEIMGLGLAIVRPGNHVNCGFTDFDVAGLLLAAVALLQARVMANMAPKD